MIYVEKCRADASCATLLGEAEGRVALGDSFLAAIQASSTTTNNNLANLLTCTGLHASTCEPMQASTPQTTDTDILMLRVPGVIEGEVVNPTHMNNPANIPVVETTPPRIISCQFPIMSTAKYSFARSESIFGRRRLLAGSATAIVQVSTSGNQNIIGSTAASPAATAKFTAGVTASSPTSSASAGASASASAGGVGVAGTALIAVAGVAVFGAVVVGVAYKKKASKQGAVSNANSDVVQNSDMDDQTDVL